MAKLVGPIGKHEKKKQSMDRYISISSISA